MKQAIFPKIFQPFQCDQLIRLGKANDGGYLINRSDIDNAKTLLSLGIGEDVSFERDFTKINDCQVTAYDKSVSKVHTDFFIGNKIHIEKHIGEDISFSEAMQKCDGDIFLKCDIDGAEYKILGDIINNAHKFTGLALEFHFIGEYANFNALTNFISKVDLKLVHTHANNYGYSMNQDKVMPNFIELSFSSEKNLRYNEFLTLPHQLDMPNNPEDQEIKIVF